MCQKKSRRLVLIAVGITGIIAILGLSLVGLFSYTPDTSVPFPYISPPEDGYYIEATAKDLGDIFLGTYQAPRIAAEHHIGKSFIFKNIKITETLLSQQKSDIYFMVYNVIFEPKDYSDLRHLKEGDVIDVLGVCQGILEEHPINVVVKNCLFLPAGVAPLPLPGGPAPVTAGY